MSSRKLQQEFEKLQKKVAEGLQQFEEIYEKVGSTENPSLKEKLEGDLRKEIKKLQRSRDQVKQWSGDSSNKLDKNVLQEIRSKIENAMERFKEVEKVSKMKQFSNEGLELQTKLGARGLDEAKKNEASRYITDVLDELNRQNELLSGEIAQISNKKKSSAVQANLDTLNGSIERNNGHIAKLELVLRSLENQTLEPEKIDEIKDDLDYYVENNQSSDFVEYDDFYDLLELDDSAEPPVVLHVAEPSVSATSPKKNTPSPAPESKPSVGKVDPKSGVKAAEPKAAVSSEPKTTEVKSSDHKPSQHRAVSAGSSIYPGTSSEALSPSVVSTASASSGGVAPMSAPSAAPYSRAPPPGLNPQSKSSTPVTAPKLTVAEELKKRALAQAAAAASKSPATNPSTPTATAPGTVPTMVSTPTFPPQSSGESASPSPVLTSENKVLLESTSRLASLVHNRLSNPLPFQSISQQLEASLLNCPDSFDSEKPRQYNPVNVHPSSVDYPQEPMYELNAASIMQKFDTDTLFFCFYYNETQDALSKWNAARELSRRGWVFNIDTKQWFSQDSKPKSRASALGAANGDKEVASQSYKYFDYQNSWLVRRKDDYEFKAEWKRTF